MRRRILIGIGEFIRRMEFNAIMGLIISIVSVILPLLSRDDLSDFFGFNLASELINYVLVVVGVIFVIVILFQIIGWLLVMWGENFPYEIKIIPLGQPDQEQQWENANKRTVFRYFASIKIINEESHELTDCYVTLRNPSRASPSKEFSQQLSQLWFGQGTSKLKWKSTDDCNNKLGPHGGEEILHIYQVAINLDNKAHSIGISDFCICKNSQIRLLPVGTYEFISEVNGKLNGKDIRPIPFSGFFDVSVTQTKNEISVSGLVIKEGIPKPEEIIAPTSRKEEKKIKRNQ